MDTRSFLDSELGSEHDDDYNNRNHDDSYHHQRKNIMINASHHHTVPPTAAPVVGALPQGSNLLSTFSMHNQDASHEHSAIDLFDNLRITEDGDIELTNIYYFGNEKKPSSDKDKQNGKNGKKNAGSGSNNNVNVDDSDEINTLYSNDQSASGRHRHRSSSSSHSTTLTSSARRVPLTDVSKVQIAKFSDYQQALSGFLVIVCATLVISLGGLFCEKCSNPGEKTFPCDAFRAASSSSSSSLPSGISNNNSSDQDDLLPDDVGTRLLHYYSMWIFVAFVIVLMNSRRVITLFKVLWNFLLPSRISFYSVRVDFKGAATRPLLLSYNNYDSKRLNPVKLCDLICKSRMNLFGLSNLLTFNVNHQHHNRASQSNQKRQSVSAFHHGGDAAATTTSSSSPEGRNKNRGSMMMMQHHQQSTESGVVYSSGSNSAFSQRLPLSGKILTITSEYIRLEGEPSALCCSGAWAADTKNVKMMFLDDVGEISVIRVPLAKGSSADFANFCMLLSVGICVVAGIGVGARWFHIGSEDTDATTDVNVAGVTTNHNGIVVILVLVTSIFIFLVGLFLHLFASRYALLVSSKSSSILNVYNPLKSMMSSLASSFVIECAVQRHYHTNGQDCDESEELEQAEAIISVIRTAQRERRRMLSMSAEERREVYGGYYSSAAASVLDESEIASRMMDA